MKLLLRCIVFSVVLALVIAVSIWLLFTVLGGEQTFCWGVSWRLSCIVFGLVLVYSLANIHDDAARSRKWLREDIQLCSNELHKYQERFDAMTKWIEHGKPPDAPG